MFSLTIAFSEAAREWTLMFTEAERAKAAFKIATGRWDSDNNVLIEDDFGQELFVVLPYVSGVMLEDLNKSIEAHAYKSVHQAKAMALASQKANQDPELQRAAQQARAQQISRGNGGPPIIGPRMS